jgi:hypothetical protein
MMGIKKKKKGGCLSASFRSESSSPDREISYSWSAFFRGCIMQGRKTAKGSKNRIENISHHHQNRKTRTENENQELFLFLFLILVLENFLVFVLVLYSCS